MKNFFPSSDALEYAKAHFVELLLFVVTLYLLYRILASTYFLGKKLPPGPIGLPVVGYLPFLGSEPHKTLAKLQEKYGDIICLRIGINYVVVLNEYNVLKEAVSHPATFNRPESLFGGLRLGFGAASGEEWSEQRRYVVHVMRNLGLGRGPWEALTKESTAAFLEELRSYKGKPVIIMEELQGSLSNNIMSLLYGKRLQPQTEKDKIRTLAKFSDLGVKYFGSSSPSSLIPGFKKLCEYLRIGEFAEVAKSTKDFVDISEKEIEKHWNHDEYQSYEDFINLYKTKVKQMRSVNEKHFFNDNNLIGHATSLFLGSSDTGTSSLRYLFRLMAAHPDVQEKVHKELDEVIGRDGSVTYDERAKVPYTFAVLLEAQRYATIVPLTTARVASEEFEIRGYTIPKGTLITGNTWAMHNDPNYWKDPELFQPERFLTDDGKEIRKNLPSYGPFSFGKRNCPGETVAWMVLLSVFTGVMQNFDIRPPRGEKVSFEATGGIVLHLHPQPICFVERH